MFEKYCPSLVEPTGKHALSPSHPEFRSGEPEETSAIGTAKPVDFWFHSHAKMSRGSPMKLGRPYQNGPEAFGVPRAERWANILWANEAGSPAPTAHQAFWRHRIGQTNKGYGGSGSRLDKRDSNLAPFPTSELVQHRLSQLFLATSA